MSTLLHRIAAMCLFAASVSRGIAVSGAQEDYNLGLTKRAIRYILATEPKEPAQVAVKSSLEALTKKNQPIRVSVRQEGDAYSAADYLYDSVSDTLDSVARSSNVEPTITLHLPHFFSKFDVHASGKKLTLYLNPELSYDPPKKE
jgi:hypothetical protein